MAISLEHRFFGLSNASNASNPIEQYKSMSLENVIADAVAFVNHVKASVPGAGDSKAIVTGGSYGGFLTTVLKMNQPEVFYGAIPYAAPLRSIGANYQNPKRFDWFTWVSRNRLTTDSITTDPSAIGRPNLLGPVRHGRDENEASIRGLPYTSRYKYVRPSTPHYSL